MYTNAYCSLHVHDVPGLYVTGAIFFLSIFSSEEISQVLNAFNRCLLVLESFSEQLERERKRAGLRGGEREREREREGEG